MPKFTQDLINELSSGEFNNWDIIIEEDDEYVLQKLACFIAVCYFEGDMDQANLDISECFGKHGFGDEVPDDLLEAKKLLQNPVESIPINELYIYYDTLEAILTVINRHDDLVTLRNRFKFETVRPDVQRYKSTLIPLHAFVYMGSIENVEKLISLNVDIKEADEHGYAALEYAAMRHDSAELIDLLVRAGADINHSNDDSAPIVLAARKNHTNAVKALLTYEGIDLTREDYSGRNALEHAVENDSGYCVFILLTAGANFLELLDMWDNIKTKKNVMIACAQWLNDEKSTIPVFPKRIFKEILLRSHFKGSARFECTLSLYDDLRRKQYNKDRNNMTGNPITHLLDGGGNTLLHDYAKSYEDDPLTIKMILMALLKNPRLHPYQHNNDGLTAYECLPKHFPELDEILATPVLLYCLQLFNESNVNLLHKVLQDLYYPKDKMAVYVSEHGRLREIDLNPEYIIKLLFDEIQAIIEMANTNEYLVPPKFVTCLTKLLGYPTEKKQQVTTKTLAPTEEKNLQAILIDLQALGCALTKSLFHPADKIQIQSASCVMLEANFIRMHNIPIQRSIQLFFPVNKRAKKGDPDSKRVSITPAAVPS